MSAGHPITIPERSNGQALRACASASWVRIPLVIRVPIAQLVRATVL